MKMKETTTRGQARKGDRPREGRLWGCHGRASGSTRCEATPHGRSTAQSNPRADGQEPNRRPIRRVEGAQHSEDVWYARGGKFGGSPVEQRAITWGMGAQRTWSLRRRAPRGVSAANQISRASAPEKSAEVVVVGKTSRGRDARFNNDTGGLPSFLSGQANCSFLLRKMI